MTDAEQLAYFRDVLTQLGDLRARRSRISHRFHLIDQAAIHVANLVGDLIVEGRKRSSRKARKQ
jgi:hypothetical protein